MDEADDAAERLVNSSLLRVLDRDRRRFQLHALLREQLRKDCGAGELENLQQSHAASMERDWGRLEEALALLRWKEAICLELGNKVGLGHCYWNWGSLARKQGDKQTERQKFEQALAIFSDLKMPRERDAVQADLDKTDAA